MCNTDTRTTYSVADVNRGVLIKRVHVSVTACVALCPCPSNRYNPYGFDPGHHQSVHRSSTSFRRSLFCRRARLASLDYSRYVGTETVWCSIFDVRDTGSFIINIHPIPVIFRSPANNQSHPQDSFPPLGSIPRFVG